MPIPQFTFAFQPIVDVGRRRVYAQEALIRGTARQSAAEILNACVGAELYELDERARAQAIALASRLGLDCLLSINFMPNSLTAAPHSLDHTLAAAEQCSFPIERLILEVTEGEMIQDMRRLGSIIDRCRARGMRVAIDDFGAGYSGLNLLANFQPDQIKLDLTLVCGIESHGPRQAIIRAVGQICNDLGIDVIAEGVETEGEYTWLATEGVRLFQGYLFAKPALESFPPVHYP